MSVLGPANQLQIASYAIGGIEVPKELVASFETKISYDSLIVEGQLIVDDVMDLGNLIKWTPGDQTDVVVRFIDIFDGELTLTYRVMNIESLPGGIHNRTLIFQLRDVESWELSRCFLSKGFGESSIGAFEIYLSHLGLDVSVDNQAQDSDVAGDNFVVPANVSALEFFESEFRRRGILGYRDYEGYHFYGCADLQLRNLPIVDPDTFTDETDNQLYKNRILDVNYSFFSRENSPKKTTALFWDPESNTTITSNDFSYDGISLNDTPIDFTGNSSRLQVLSTNNFGERDWQTAMDSLKQSTMTIVVNGYARNAVFRIFTVRLKGNKGVVESQTAGNTVVGAKWLSTSVTTKVVGDSMIQKVILSRADGVKQV